MNGIRALPVAEGLSYFVDKLPRLHRDPFDRMLICQAIVGGMTILTPDPLIRQYPEQTAW